MLLSSVTKHNFLVKYYYYNQFLSSRNVGKTVAPELSLLVNLTPATYSGTPKSTAHHGFISTRVTEQVLMCILAPWSPSLACRAGYMPGACGSVYVLLWYAGRLRATLTSRRASTDTKIKS